MSDFEAKPSTPVDVTDKIARPAKAIDLPGDRP